MKAKSYLSILRSESGRTLLEIVISFAILAIIIIPFTSLFIQSGKNISKSEEMMDATYITQSVMEEVYHLSKTIEFQPNMIIGNITGETKQRINDETYIFFRDDYFIELFLQKHPSSNELVHVLVKVYRDEKKEILEAQMETSVAWRNE